MVIPLVLLAASTSDTSRRNRLLVHADSLYSMAHALTLNATEAAALVERVFDRAAEEELPAENERAWLLRLLHDERSKVRAGASAEMEREPRSGGDFRRKLALRAVQRTMPTAFAALPVDEREILMLVHVERYNREEVAEVTGETGESVDERLRDAEAALRAGVERSLSANEIELLQHIGPMWLRDAVNDMVANDLPALPPTVRTELSGPVQSGPVAPDASPRRRKRKKRDVSAILKRMGTALLIIFFTGLIAYGAARILDRPPETNALILSADAATRVRPDLSTSDAGAVERYVRETLDWNLTVPAIENSSLLGVQITEIGDQIRVPVIYYDDAESEEPLTVVVYTYALLDRAGERLQFEPATLSQIQDAGHYELHDLGRQQLLIWRHRSNIFVAVTRGQAEALQDRIYPAL